MDFCFGTGMIEGEPINLDFFQVASLLNSVGSCVEEKG